MKAKKFITKAYNGELGLTMCQDWKSLLEKEFPELVKKEGVFKDGDVVKCTDGSICRIVEVEFGTAYGFSPSGQFYMVNVGVAWSFVSSPKSWEKASPEEWKSRLIEECKKRGIWDTPNIKATAHVVSDEGRCFFEYYDLEKDILWSEYGRVYEKGVFATPIKTISLSEAEKQLGVKIDVTK